MLDWMLNLPWVVMFLFLTGSFALYGVVGVSITRRFILPRLGRVEHHTEVTSTFLHGVLIIYGLAVALLAIAVWEKYAEVMKTVSAEATEIAALYRDAGAYPEPTRTRLRSEIKAYTEQVIHHAWPTQQSGKIPTAGVVHMDSVVATLMSFEPTTNGQMAVHRETLSAFNEMYRARRLRVDYVTSGLPTPMWAVVLLGALVTLGSAFFFDVSSIRLHRIMIVLLSAVMGMLIFLIAFYDRPLRGKHSVTPEAYELIYHQLMEH